MLGEEEEGIQNKVSDEEKEESCQHSTDVIRTTPQASKIFPKTGLIWNIKFMVSVWASL